MARRKGMEPMHDEHVNVTPLIDVIMCLIIFFLVAGHLAKAEANMALTIPRARDGKQMDDAAGRLLINVTPAGRVDANGVEIPVKPGSVIDEVPNAEPDVFVRGQKMGINELRLYLRKEKKDSPNLKIVIRADEKISYMWIAPILVACAQADIKSVNFSTRND